MIKSVFDGGAGCERGGRLERSRESGVRGVRGVERPVFGDAARGGVEVIFRGFSICYWRYEGDRQVVYWLDLLGQISWCLCR